ncbi:MAG: Xaa-Pro peptidase family protein [Thermoleophilia bacterium]
MIAAAVPGAELERRLAAFQAALRADGLDGAVIVQSVDLYYLTGTTQSSHLVVPASGEPVLLVRKTLERARIESALDRIEPLRSLRDLADAIFAAGIAGGRLGLELDVLPATRYLDYARRLEGFELADCSGALRRLRSVKSPWELDRIREAGRMLAGLGECMAQVLREGMTEVELAAEVERWLRRQGHQGVVRMRAFNGEVHYGTITSGPSAAEPGGTDTPLVGVGMNPYVGKGPSTRPIRRGEPVIVDLCGASLGYISDQTRTYSLGPLAPRLREAYELARSIMHQVAAAAAPGVPGSSLYELANDLAGDLRPAFASADRISFVAHGFGLELDEPPFLARGYDQPLEPGMVFALEPKFFFPDEGAVGVENSYAVTETGVEVLTPEPDELLEL